MLTSYQRAWVRGYAYVSHFQFVVVEVCILRRKGRGNEEYLAP